jgi:hypothetical protein
VCEINQYNSDEEISPSFFVIYSFAEEQMGTGS